MQAAGAAGAAWEVCVFLLFVVLTTCAPLWRRRGGGGGGADGGGGGGGGGKAGYVFAGGASGVGYLAMILSVARGTLGVRSFLGFPAELVYRGSAMWETLYGMCLAFPLVAYTLLPLYFHMRTTSVYEYLEVRFGSASVRRCASGTFVLRQLLNLAVTLYTPAVALHAAVGAPPAAAAAALAALAAAATLLGGLSAAIRADVIQSVTMVVVSVAFIVQATLQAGGPAQVLRDNLDGGRIQFFTFTWDPRTRVDTLSAVVGQLFMSLSVYGCQQTFVQRYLSLRSAARARRTLLAAAPAVALAFSLSWVCGLALYALYRRCDPLLRGRTAAPDELLPFYVADQLAAWPGMMGLFLGTLFNGALSFLVSNVNSLATVTWEDFVSCAPSFRGASDAHQLTVIKIIGLIYTAVIMCLSLVVGRMGGAVEGSLLVTAATSGALLGVFVLAGAAPRCGARGALAGMLAAHALTGALAAARLTRHDTGRSMLPLSTEGCENDTISLTSPTTTSALALSALANYTLTHLAPLLREPVLAPAEPSTGWAVLQFMCDLSYMWYAVIGTLVCVCVGNLVGVLFDRHTVDPALLHPWLARYYYNNKDHAEKDSDTTKKSAGATKSAPPVVVLTPPPAPPLPVALACTANRQFDAYATETQRTRF